MNRSTRVTSREVTSPSRSMSPHDIAASDTRGSSGVTHKPLDADRHAAIVAELIRHVPNAWRVLFAPADYLFDSCDICPTPRGKYPHDCGLMLMAEMTQLRAAFMRTTDWHTANSIIRTLIRKDDRACRMSVGIRMNGRAIYGEAV